MYYIAHYEAYVLIFWSIFLLVYFLISYKLYKSKEFYLFIVLFLVGFYIFSYFLPDSLVNVQKQRIRYLDLAYNFYKYGIFAHELNGRFLTDIHLAYCSIPLIFSVSFFGPVSMFKFTLWYTIFSLIVMLYLGYKIYKSTNKRILLIFSYLLIFPFVFYEFLNPYNYPEFSNMLLFSIFLYLILNKKDDRAFLILPLLLSSGNEYIFFLVFMPLILKFLNVGDYLKKLVIYYVVAIVIAFPYVYLTIFHHFLGELELFFRPYVYLNTIKEIERNAFPYLPFIVFFILSFYLLIEYLKKREHIKIVFVSFYLAFIIIISGWGVTPYDHLYLHFLPNLLPIILFLSKDLDKRIALVTLILYITVIIYLFKSPYIFRILPYDNLQILLMVSNNVPIGEEILLPRENEAQYFRLLGIDFKYHTFFNVPINKLNDTYYFITTEFMRNNNNFNFDRAHREILRFCNLTYKEKQWEIYKCGGYDKDVVDVLNFFRSQKFG